MNDWTTLQSEKPIAKEIRKFSIDSEVDIRDIVTRSLEKGFPVVRAELLSQRNNTTAPHQSQVLNKA